MQTSQASPPLARTLPSSDIAKQLIASVCPDILPTNSYRDDWKENGYISSKEMSVLSNRPFSSAWPLSEPHFV
jgi:hypothetical protein